MVSSVEPEVAAVPMTMAAATPRSNGQSTNGFAKVEQGKSYVLSVKAPSGSGEVELLAADSDTQSEPDMFSLLYTKVEKSMQIPFVAVSSWVYVQAGNSSINWLVTPANFSLAVPGASSGGGSSFDPASDQEITGNWTFAGAVNANGGINVPLAVGAPTNESGVNRLYAAGLAGVTDIFSQHAYLNTGSITATGTAATTAFIPGQYAQVRVPAGTHSTIVFPFTGPNGQHNYSNFAGFSIPLRILGAGKITIGIGRGGKTTRSDLTQGSYSIIPGNNLAHNSGEILDITFDNVRDATRGGYVVKVREIYALSKAAGWSVKTTTSFVPATHNEPIPSIVNKIIYHQRTQYKFESEYISYGSLYLLTGGGQTVQLHKIAAVRGINAFETGVGISSIVTDLPGNASGDVYMQAGSAVRTLYQPGDINPVYYALEALARNDIEAEETADFVDINIPLK